MDLLTQLGVDLPIPESQSFDLTPLVEFEAKRNVPRARLIAAGWTCFGLAILSLGLYVALFRVGATSVQQVQAAVFVVVGAVIAVYAWSYPRAYLRRPNLLTVSDASLAYGRADNPPLRAVRWGSFDSKLLIYDRRKDHQKLGEKDRFSRFSLVVGYWGFTSFPIPEAAVQTLELQARHHGLQVEHSSLGSVAVTIITGSH